GRPPPSAGGRRDRDRAVPLSGRGPRAAAGDPRLPQRAACRGGRAGAARGGCHRPGARDRGARRRPGRASLRPRADAAGGAPAGAVGPARVGGADGLRLRGVLRLRRAGRRPAEAALHRRARAVMLLNASGCLDALAAPEVAAQLDAFVTKTVTPEPREGNPPVRIAETEFGMLNAIGLANPGRARFLAETLPALPTLRAPLS